MGGQFFLGFSSCVSGLLDRSQCPSATHSWFLLQADVINRGFSGFTSRAGLYLMNEILDLGAFGSYGPNGGPRIKLATLWFGNNDAAMPGRRE